MFPENGLIYSINIYDIIYSVSLFIFRQEVFSHRQMIKIKSVEFSKLKNIEWDFFVSNVAYCAWIIISISKINSYLPCCLFRVCFIDKIRKLDQAMKREKFMLFKIDDETKQQVPSDTDMLTMLHTMSEWWQR